MVQLYIGRTTEMVKRSVVAKLWRRDHGRLPCVEDLGEWEADKYAMQRESLGMEFIYLVGIMVRGYGGGAKKKRDR